MTLTIFLSIIMFLTLLLVFIFGNQNNWEYEVNILGNSDWSKSKRESLVFSYSITKNRKLFGYIYDNLWNSSLFDSIIYFNFFHLKGFKAKIYIPSRNTIQSTELWRSCFPTAREQQNMISIRFATGRLTSKYVLVQWYYLWLTIKLSLGNVVLESFWHSFKP